MVPGVGRIEQVDSQLLGWAADRGLKVELPNGGQAAGQFSFDAMLGDLASHSDQTTARVTAKSIEYPHRAARADRRRLAVAADRPVGPHRHRRARRRAVPAAATRRNRR
jgi:hypothetical protein